MDSSASTGAMLDFNHVLANQALAPRPTFLDVPRDLGPSLVLPFQIQSSEWTGAAISATLDIAANSKIRTLLLPYRYAQLESLELVVLPAQTSSKYPGTLDIRFIASDVTPDFTDMIENPGAVRVTMGGPIGAISNSVVPCPLKSFSPVIKSPFLPTDRVKVAVGHWLNADATKADNKHVLITTILRGTVRVGYPNDG
nr:MAG: capsid protein [Tymovirales sp.]